MSLPWRWTPSAADVKYNGTASEADVNLTMTGSSECVAGIDCLEIT